MIPHTFCPSHASSPMPPLLPSLTFSWLLCPSIEWRPSKAETPPPSLFFDVFCLRPLNKWSNTGDWKLEGSRSFNTLLGSCGAKIWGHHCLIHRERAKPLDRAAVAAHFDCCVCVSGCALCEGATFNYQTGRKSTLAKANIRSAKQDDNYGASNIVLPCPGS